MAYNPSPLGDSLRDIGDLARYVQEELQAISAFLQLVEQGLFIPETNKAPAKPRDAMVVFADGTNWNPGAGRGLYVYYTGAWHFAG